MARNPSIEVEVQFSVVGVLGWVLAAIACIAALVAVLKFWHDHDTKAEAACQARSCYSTGSKPVLLPSGGPKPVCVCMEAPK